MDTSTPAPGPQEGVCLTFFSFLDFVAHTPTNRAIIGGTKAGERFLRHQPNQTKKKATDMIANISMVGRLAADPEVRQLDSGLTMTKCTIVTSHRTKKGDEYVDVPCFTDFTLWGSRGDTFARFHQKGSPVSLTGTLTQDRWENAEGQTRTKHVITNVQWAFVPSSKGASEGDVPHDYSNVPF